MVTPPTGLAIIACAVLDDEIGHYARDMDHLRHVEMLPQGLHNDPPALREQVQTAIDRVERMDGVETIALVYGLCSRGTEGVFSRTCRLVIARAHDCITHLLGSRERYAEYVREHPGTYWYSPGWNRHHTPPGPERHEKLYDEYLERFGPDNADYLMETEQHWFKTYDRATWVDLTVGATDAGRAYTRQCAQWLEWNYDQQAGDPALLVDLLSGPWDDDRFLVLEPGQTLRMTGDERIVAAAPAGDPGLEAAG